MRIAADIDAIKRQNVVWCLLLIAFIGGITWQVLRLREPVYMGKPLNDWLADLDVMSVHSPENAAVAVRAIGTNSFRELNCMLQTTDPFWKRTALAFNAKQSLFQLPILPASVVRYRAVQGYATLGAAAKEQVSVLIEIMGSAASAEVRSDVATALGAIGPEAKPAIPVLMRAAQDSDSRLRKSAVFALSNIQRYSQSGVHFLDSPTVIQPRF